MATLECTNVNTHHKITKVLLTFVLLEPYAFVIMINDIYSLLVCLDRVINVAGSND